MPNTIRIVNLIFEYSFVIINILIGLTEQLYSHLLRDASELIMTVPLACSAAVELVGQHVSS